MPASRLGRRRLWGWMGMLVPLLGGRAEERAGAAAPALPERVPLSPHHRHRGGSWGKLFSLNKGCCSGSTTPLA